MIKKYGVSSTGLIAPIIREGDNLAEIVTDTVLNAIDNIEDGDVIGITESVVARAQGNYVTIDEVAKDIKRQLNNPKEVFLIKPIYSRNRFAMILKAFARAVSETVYIYMPLIDEVGNVLRNHPFTGLNYDEYYKSIIEGEGKKFVLVESDTDSHFDVVRSEVPTVNCTLRPDEIDAEIEFTLAHFCHDKCEWGLLGSNKASEEKLKLFPSKKFSKQVVEKVVSNIYEKTGKKVFVMIYGDGCFKSPNPEASIWEFADPVTSPACSEFLLNTPNELKLKNIADEKYANLSGKELEEAIKLDIQNKDNNLKGNMVSQGTTPRRYVDLLASLMDLTSGSGDKGTPIVYVKRYFENFATKSKEDTDKYIKVRRLLNPISERIDD